MYDKNPEIKLLIKVLAIIGAIAILLATGLYIFLKLKAPYLLEFSQNITEYRIEVDLDSLEGARFISGMNGCENLALSPYNLDFYVSCLDGSIHRLEKEASNGYSLVQSVRFGRMVLGMVIGTDTNLYALVAEGDISDWKKNGGAVVKISPGLDVHRRITGNFQAINGMASDSRGNLYFTSSNAKWINPQGKVYRMRLTDNGTYAAPELFLEDTGTANGLYYGENQDWIYYSNTLGGVYWFSPEDAALHAVYLKLHFLEATDDICTDISGNIWMTDPGQSTIKYFNPGTNRVVRFNIKGIGQTSSCRIRTENGREMLYITELQKIQKPMRMDFDGRGVLIVPANSLISLLEPFLIDDQ